MTKTWLLAPPTSAPAGRGALPRRAALRSAVLAAGALAVAAVPGGLAAASALPSRAASGRTVLVWRPWYNFPNGTGQSALALMQHGIEPWLAQNPGVEVKITTLGYQGATLIALLTGSGPDIFEDWVLPPYIESNLVYNFEPFVKQDNVNLGIFPSGEMDYFFSAGRFGGQAGLYCLPAYIHTLGMAVNLGVLDQLGLKYPEPDWTQDQWASMWKSSAIKSSNSSKVRYGGAFYWSGYDYYGDNPAPFYLKGFGGGYVDPSKPTRSFIDQPGSVEGLSWCYDLINEGVIGSAPFHTGQQVSMPRGTAGGLPHSATAWGGVKWDLFAMPVWPKGRYTFAASDFYAISSATKRPDIAWSFLKFLCVEPTWQMYMVRLALNGPNQKSLYPQWAEIVKEVAPPLRDKNLDVIVQAVQNDEPYFGHTFQYSDAQSAAIINKYSLLAQAQKMSVTAATGEIAKQVDALQAVGRSLALESVKSERAFEQFYTRSSKTTTPFQVPTPPRVDAGAPAVVAAKLVTVKKPATYVLTAAGTGFVGSADGGTFAGAPYTSTGGTFTARLTSISPVKAGGTIANGAKIGLMARSSLSDGAAASMVEVAVGRGVHFETRPVPGQGTNDQQSNSTTGGLLDGSVILRSNSVTAANYLLKPVWLRLQRSGATWTAFTSLDGKNWTQAGKPDVLEAEGVWLGLYATSHQSGVYLRATFDSLAGFPTPSTFVQIGTA